MSEIQNKKTATTGFIRSKWVEWIFINLPFVCYLALLGIIYIFNAHASERSLRKIDSLRREVKDYNWQYMSLKQQLMHGSTQSQLSKKLEGQGLKPLSEVPKRLGGESIVK